MHKDPKNIILPKNALAVIENDIGGIPADPGYLQDGIGTGVLCLALAVMNNETPGHLPGIAFGMIKFDLIKFNMIEFNEFPISKKIPYRRQFVEAGPAHQGASPAGHERHEIFFPKTAIRRNSITSHRDASEFLTGLSRLPASPFLPQKAWNGLFHALNYNGK
jgi:hypothetical protein